MPPYKQEEPPAWAALRDERLVALACGGHGAAFDMLVKRYEARLYNYLRRMCGNAADAEDVFQETFLRVYKNLNAFQQDRLFRPWLYQIATNASRDFGRSRRRRLARFLSGRQNEEGRDYLEEAASPAPGPREYANAEETAARLAAAVSRLPEGQRAVFLMARYHEMPYDEIADALNIPVGTVKSRMNTAVKFLLSELGDER